MTTRSPGSSQAAKVGNQRPTKFVVPGFSSSFWEMCHKINASGGLKMLEWQDLIMQGWLGVDERGKWSAPTCAGSVPRQNGKSLGLVEARANFGLIHLGEQIVYTSHLQKTSTETFEDMANFFDQPKFRKRLKDIKTALGREQIIMNNGGRIKFLARTRNGGRGQHGDLLIFDEALELDAKQQASFLPAISASANPQTIYVSTPPEESSEGYVFRDIRNRAINGESSKTAWFEWSVDEIGDVRDRSRWYLTNPSLGLLIRESTVESECEQMDPDTFARERLGWWSPEIAAIHPISSKDWSACEVRNPPGGEPITYAVKFSPDGTVGSIAVCVDGDTLFVEVAANRSMRHGVRWFVDWLSAREGIVEAIVIDGKSNAQTLVDKLIEAGVDDDLIVRPTTADVIAANSAFVDATRARTVSHAGQPALVDSATLSDYRKIGTDGGFGFQSNDNADATLVEACALAYWCAMSIRRNPRQELRIG